MLSYNPLNFNISDAIVHAQGEWPNESVGYIFHKSYIPCINSSNEPENSFIIQNEEFDKRYINGEVEAIIHSHNSRAYASSIDQMKCDEMELPFGIINLIDPEIVTHCIFWGKGIKKADYLGRLFFFGVFDCLTLVCDYYKQKFKIKLPSPYRDFEFITSNHKFFEEYIGELKQFDEVGIDDLQEDDILFYCHSGRIIHIGIYIDENKILHHWLNQKSNFYPLKYKKEMLKFALRRKQS